MCVCVSKQSWKIALSGGYAEWRWKSEFIISGESVLRIRDNS